MKLTGFPSLFSTSERELALVNKYFHLDRIRSDAQALQNLDFIRYTFAQMYVAIAHVSPMTQLGTGYFQEDPTAQNNPAGPNLAYTFYGGFTRRRKNGSGPR